VQAAVRSAVRPDLLDQTAQAAADALAEVWPADQPRSWLAAALRACAISLRQAAALRRAAKICAGGYQPGSLERGLLEQFADGHTGT
jgi:hypothetical protein